jgi:hypothetical protein
MEAVKDSSSASANEKDLDLLLQPHLDVVSE